MASGCLMTACGRVQGVALNLVVGVSNSSNLFLCLMLNLEKPWGSPDGLGSKFTVSVPSFCVFEQFIPKPSPFDYQDR